MTLARRTPLRARPRSKGNRAEREIVDLLRSYGWTSARRNWQSGGQGGGDIIGGPIGAHLEIKHREECAIWEWLRQAEAEARPTDIPTVVFRRNRSPWWAVMPSDEWAALLFFTDRTTYTLVRSSRRCQLWNWLEQADTEAPQQEARAIPVVRFSRPGSIEYSAAPATTVLELLRERELA